MAAPTFVSGATLTDGIVAGTYAPLAAVDLSDCAVAVVQVGLAANSSGATITIDTGTTSGWTKLGQQQVASGNAVSAVFYRIAPTSIETLNVASSDTSGSWTSEVMRFASANSIAGASAAGGRNPPSYDAGAVRDYMWLEFMIAQTTPASGFNITGASSGYSNLTGNTSGNSPAIGAATKDGTASQTEDPGTWTGGVAPRNASWTIALWQGSVTINQSCLATTSPTASLQRSAGLIQLATTSPAALLSRSMGLIRLGTTSPIALLRRWIGLIRLATTAPTASLFRSDALFRLATTSPAASLQRSTSLIRLVATAPAGLLARASALSKLASTSPQGALVRSIGKILQASTGGLQEVYGPELVYNGSIGPTADGWTLLDGATASGDGRIHWGSGGVGPTAIPTMLNAPQNGGTYELTYTISDYATGTIRPRLQTFFTLRSSNGTFTERKTLSSSGATFQFNNTTSINDLYFTNVSLRLVSNVGPASLSLSTLRSFIGSSAPVASAVRSISLIRQAVATVITSRFNRVGKSLSGSSNVTALLVRALQKILGANASATASLERQTGKTFAATTAPMSSSIRQIGKNSLASSAPVSFMTKANLRSILVGISALAFRSVRINLIRVANTSGAGLFRRSTNRSFQKGVAVQPSVGKTFFLYLRANATTETSLLRTFIFRPFIASVQAIGSLTKRLFHLPDECSIIVLPPQETVIMFESCELQTGKFPARYTPESRLYGVDFSRRLDRGEVIDVPDVTLMEGDIAIADVQNNDTVVTFRLSGGSAVYQRLAIRVTTTATPPNIYQGEATIACYP